MLISVDIVTEPIILLVIMEILTEQYTQGEVVDVMISDHTI